VSPGSALHGGEHNERAEPAGPPRARHP
jgi:hypothetical protein